MNLVSVNNISRLIDDRVLFSNVTFGIDSGRKVALIGNNGTGKSTILKMIAGLVKPDDGVITTNKAAKIAFLEQIPDFNPKDTIIEHILKGEDKILKLIAEYEMICKSLSKDDSKNLQDRFNEVSEELTLNNGWDYERLVKKILTDFDITDYDLKMGELSGGMIKKVSLAQVIVSNPDLLILDEPTNHLDLKTILSLEQILTDMKNALLLVTHDRYFLDRISNTIIEIDRNKITRFEGNYTFYMEKREEIINSLIKEDERINNLLRKEMEWYRRQPKARTTKSRSRMEKVESMMNHENYKENQTVDILLTGGKTTKKILEVNNVSKSYNGKSVIKDFSYVFRQNEKIGIAGANGSGKTTLLGLIIGQITSDSGSIDIGQNTLIGYFSQSNNITDTSLRVIDYIKESAEDIILKDGVRVSASKLLEKFLFSKEAQYTAINKLSGGELRRLSLLKVLISNPNFLVLDEPTNDLDLATLMILEEFLENFPGTVVVVTHDRFFMNRITDTILVIEDSVVSKYPGNYSDYIEAISSDKSDKQPVEKTADKIPAVIQDIKSKKKLSFKEKKELETIFDEITELETVKTELEKELSSPVFDKELLIKTQNRYDEVSALIEEKIKRWEYLESIAQ